MKFTLKKVIAWSLVVLNLAVIVWFWSQTSTTFVIGTGRLAGLLLEFALLLQLVFIGRIPWVEQAFGHDGLNRLHRVLGYSLVILLIAHPLLLSVGYEFGGQSVGGSFISLVNSWPNVGNALIGVLLFVAVIALSVPWVRRRLNYDAWHGIHLLTYLAILFAFGHQQTGGDFRNHTFFVYWMALNFGVFGFYLLFRFLRPFWLLMRHRFVVQRVVQESSDSWSVYITGQRLDRFQFRAGQFANVIFFARGLWMPHPYSFSREFDGHTLRFTIKSLGGVTTRVQNLRPGTHVLIDGPLGIFTADRAVTNRYLLIAGGIGVTPIRALAAELAMKRADVVVLYSVRGTEHSALLSELRALIPNIHVFMGERITAPGIARAVPDVTARDAFVCGPAAMMDSVERDLQSLGVPKAHIHSERFGY